MRFVLMMMASTSWYSARGFVRPSGAPQVHADGADALRLLILGDEFSIADGVLSHDIGYAGYLARRLSSLSGRGVDIDIVAAPAMVASDCLARLADVDLARYDALVLAIGSNETRRLTSVSVWQRHLVRLLDFLYSPSGTMKVFLLGVAPARTGALFPAPLARAVARQARTLNRFTAILCSGRSGVTLIPGEQNAEMDEFETAPYFYEHWAVLSAPIIYSVLESFSSGRRPEQTPDESARQRSLDELDILEQPELRIDRITNSTKSLFGASGSAVTFIDRERQWVKSSVGMDQLDSLRIGEFCDMTIRHAEIMVVEDTVLDPRFRHHPSVTGPQQVRFYAGYPIESPDGRRVGALCIVDTCSRIFSRAEASLLRALTIQVQSELWANTPGSVSTEDRAVGTDSSEELRGGTA